MKLEDLVASMNAQLRVPDQDEDDVHAQKPANAAVASSASLPGCGNTGAPNGHARAVGLERKDNGEVFI